MVENAKTQKYQIKILVKRMPNFKNKYQDSRIKYQIFKMGGGETGSKYCFKVWLFIMVLYIFTVANIKKGPTITDIASYSLDSCLFSIVIVIPIVKT